MLDMISEGFKKATSKFQGKTTLNEENVSDALEEIRTSLLEADVEYSVVKNFLGKVKDKALGQDVSLKAGKGAEKVKVSAGDHFVKICQQELEDLMGAGAAELAFPKNRPAVMMMVGLQGTGKTTTTAKLANFLIHQQKRHPLLVAADIYRAAAVHQLKVLGERIGAPVFHIEGASPVEICKQSIKKAYELDCDTILLDTAGRLTIDAQLMQELDDIKSALKPDHTLLVCDAMMGQDAVTTAKSFNERLGIDGFIMTKLDGDARGGAALSIKEVTGKPIRFLGMGEEIDRFEVFRPQGLASRILGMGDIVGLMQDFERVAEGDKEEEALRMLSGQFTFQDFYDQISMIQKMGSLKDLIAKMPMQNMLPKNADINEKELVKIKAMIDSMTPKERHYPDILETSRVRRIAAGSGRSVGEVNELVKKFKAMRTMMGNLGKNFGGLFGKLPGMGALNKMNQMRKLMSGSGGMPGLGDFGSMLGMDEKMNKVGVAPRKIDREKLKKARKQAKKNRQKNRKK